MLARFAALLAITACLVAHAQSPDAVRKEIEATYVKALEALRQAKSLEDLDELNRSFDTQDWQSIVPGQQPRGWQELRKYGFEGLRAPFDSKPRRAKVSGRAPRLMPGAAGRERATYTHIARFPQLPESGPRVYVTVWRRGRVKSRLPATG